MEVNLDQMRDLLEDEAERAMPPPARRPPNIRVPASSEPDFFEDPGASSPSFEAGGCVDADFLDALREQLPHLANFPDAFILRTPMAVLLKMESNAMKRSSVDKSRNVDDKLAANMDLLASARLEVKEGWDDRNSHLHPCRFLPAPVCSAKQLWREAREVWGPCGPPPVSCFDVAAVGIAGYITNRGWVEVQNPGSPHMSLSLFNIVNMASRTTAAKRISLTNNEDTLEVGENLKDVASFREFKQSLRAARIAQQFSQPWNFSITSLESFLINSDFLADKVSPNPRGISALSAFCNHVFLLNSQNWRAKKDFLDVVDLVSVWAAWHPGHLGPAESARDPRPSPSGSHSNKKAATSSQASRGASGGARGGASRGRPSGRPSQATAAAADDVCRRFNIGRCPNTNGPCVTSAGITLRHVCNFRLPTGGRCLANHPRHANH